ncbi:hypothetical protein ED733_000263 [Metarhizium rileyi]|uniref:Uncharacterized protein n=1 Tax=Metarhizium rileyi (strain RCEF 4871) TaxID=1649241 RepID=A0A5C6G194_METRR|nr:hypothetical protein ED733_000263 [Metarhizium rileyi]
MAKLRERKRKRSEEPSRTSQAVKRLKPASDPAQDSLPAKRIRSTAVREISNFLPAFWDNLSKVWLTRRALRELDRRNEENLTTRSSASGAILTSLARFARRGGPDLRRLRGYPEPKLTAKMSSNRSITSSSRRTQSTKATSVSFKSKRSSAYTKNFEQDLIDNKIYPEGYEHPADRSTPEPNNLDDIIQGLSDPRASLSPSRFSQSAFKSFKQANSRVISEGKVMSSILPIICGHTTILYEGNLQFTNLDSITSDATVPAVPDLYDGSYPQDIRKEVRRDLTKTIIPTNHDRAPVAPNFFVEAKAPRGGADVAKRQACLDGAVGARAMHSLQSYGEDVPVYDGNAYTYTSTYVDGQLKLYAHHVTATPSGSPEYHMSQIDSWGMTGNAESFRRGATAFRNARDLAQRHRSSFIEAANARASRSEIAADEAEAVVNAAHSVDSSAWHDANNGLEQHVADTSNPKAYEGTAVGNIPQYLYGDDGSPENSQQSTAYGVNEPSLSFTSSLTSELRAADLAERAAGLDQRAADLDRRAADLDQRVLHIDGPAAEMWQRSAYLEQRDADHDRRVTVRHQQAVAPSWLSSPASNQAVVHQRHGIDTSGHFDDDDYSGSEGGASVCANKEDGGHQLKAAHFSRGRLSQKQKHDLLQWKDEGKPVDWIAKQLNRRKENIAKLEEDARKSLG